MSGESKFELNGLLEFIIRLNIYFSVETMSYQGHKEGYWYRKEKAKENVPVKVEKKKISKQVKAKPCPELRDAIFRDMCGCKRCRDFDEAKRTNQINHPKV